MEITKILNKKFIKTEEVGRLLGLTFKSQKNCIIHGPGGHGKSEMVNTVIRGLNLEEETFTQFFGEGMDEARLFGGLNFRKLEDEKVLEYFPENSFLNKRVAVFEELFDAPASVLLALKDVLTAKELRNGAQKFKMKTEVIICLTNKEPAEISDLGPAAHALIERFPLQLNLQWESYKRADYYQLFEKIKDSTGQSLDDFSDILADILSKATASGVFVSPRTAVHAYQLVRTSCAMRGGDRVQKQDLLDLRFLPGLEGLARTIEEDLDAALAHAEAETAIRKLEQRYEILSDYGDNPSPIKALQAAKRLQNLENKTSELRVPDNLVQRRKNLLKKIQERALHCQMTALRNTKI